MSMLLLMDDDGPSPAFSANFMSGVLPSGLTYTNSSTTRTYFGSDGLLKTAVANEAIFEWLGGVYQGMRWEMEQRTNLLTYSEQFDNAAWTKTNMLSFGSGSIADAAAAPSGLLTADFLCPNATLGIHTVSRIVAGLTSGIAYTKSVFVKAGGYGWIAVWSNTTAKGAYFNITDGAIGTVSAGVTAAIQAVGNGWYRCSVTETTATTSDAYVVFLATENGSPSFSGDGTSGVYLWGAQLEAGASASSYIPTAAAAVTRQPDVLTATSISPWYRQDEGTVVFEGIASTPATTQRGIYLFSDGTDNERISAYRASGLNGGVLVVDGGVTQADINSLSSIAQSSIFRHALAYKLNDVAGSVNNGTPVVDTSATMPTVTALTMGQGNTAGTQAFMGYARRFQYFNTRLPNAQIQGMSRV